MSCSPSCLYSLINNTRWYCIIFPALPQISVPRLIPEQKCRQVEKEICNTQMVNPHDIKKPVFIKYCTRKENLAKPTTSSYLPPGGPPADSPRSSFGGGPPPPTVSVARTSELPDQIRTSGSRGTNSFRPVKL